ncbi:MAG: RNA ligase family protein [archaeon]
MQYPKINSLWKRDEKNNFCIMEGEFSCPEFDNVKRWLATEKVDGTNIRVYFNPESDEIQIKGRTDKADIPVFLKENLEKIFTKEKLKQVFPESKTIILYGEGFGDRIQAVGKKYRKDSSFCLFDVFISGWWLERESIKKIAGELNVPVAPDYGIKTTEEIITLVKKGFKSLLASEELQAEGIVAKSYPLMLLRNGLPLVWKLKTSDYKKLEAMNSK